MSTMRPPRVGIEDLRRELDDFRERYHALGDDEPFVRWFLRAFGRYIDGLQGTSVDEVIQAISLAQGVDAPLIVNVEQGGGGEHVQVFIG